MLIGMDVILEVLETAIVSSLVKNSIPASVILIGPSGAGKSQAVLLYSNDNIPSVRHSDDLTSRGIDDIVMMDKDNKVSHVLCPDFNVVLSHRDSVVNLTSAKLMTLMSDGVCRVDDGRAVKEIKHRQMGILTAMTFRVYTKVAKRWEMLGFKRRFIPIFFDYSSETKALIQSDIRNGAQVISIKKNPISAKMKMTDIRINTKEGHAIEILSSSLAENLSYYPRIDRKTGQIGSAPGEKFLEFTPHHTLRTMAKAHALLRGRQKVDESDLKFLSRMVDFCRYGRPVMI